MLKAFILNFMSLKLHKYPVVYVLVCLFHNNIKAQKIVHTFYEDSLTKEDVSDLRFKYGTDKSILKDFEKQTLVALSYFPELKDIKIKFRLKKRTTPLATRPTFLGLFRSAKKRTYCITISEKSNAKLDTITLKNLNFNAQIGVIGHELSHISDYIQRGFLKMNRVGLDLIFSKKRIDTFEYETDLRCIDHGLGYQLLAWSINVRKNLKRPNWLGAVNLNANKNDERYMNPDTIITILNSHPLYEGNPK